MRETAEATHTALVRALFGVDGCPTAMQLHNDLFGRGLNSCRSTVRSMHYLPQFANTPCGWVVDRPYGFLEVCRQLRVMRGGVLWALMSPSVRGRNGLGLCSDILVAVQPAMQFPHESTRLLMGGVKPY